MTTAESAFSGAYVRDVDFSRVVFRKCTNFYQMFLNSKITSLPSTFINPDDSVHPTTFSSMFQSSTITSTEANPLDITGWFNAQEGTNITTGSMFFGCPNLKYIKIGNFEAKYFSSVGAMFASSGIVKVDGVFDFTGSNFTGAVSPFSECVNLTEVWIKGLRNTTNIQGAKNLKIECLKYMIANSNATSDIVIVVAYAIMDWVYINANRSNDYRQQAKDAGFPELLAAHPNVFIGLNSTVPSTASMASVQSLDDGEVSEEEVYNYIRTL